jgi:hypothetical protein
MTETAATPRSACAFSICFPTVPVSPTTLFIPIAKYTHDQRDPASISAARTDRRRLRSAPRMVLFLAVHEGALRGARNVAAKLLTKGCRSWSAITTAAAPPTGSILRCRGRSA